jgi:hypothetical protein
MQEPAVQILEARPGTGEQPPTVTASVAAAASQAIFTALSEQLDRRRQEPIESAEDVLELRQATTLTDRFEALAAAGAHAVVSLSDSDLRPLLLGLIAYTDRMDGDHFQGPEVRDRLQTITGIIAVLWDANAAVAAAAEPPLSPAGR